MKVRREVERPEGLSISYTQLSSAQACGLRLKFSRQRVKQKGIGIFLLYGRALHAGVEARSKGRARTDEEAVRIAIGALGAEIRKQTQPVQWDEPVQALKDGSPAADSYGNLWSEAACMFWLQHQVPLYLRRFPDLEVVRSEHHIFVPLTPPRGVTWAHRWSLECWLDREMRDGSIHDLKSADDAWDDRQLRKQRVQALLYMAAYYSEYGRRPTYFEFHVLPRLREGKTDFRPAPLVQTFRIEWSSELIQRYLDSIVKPQITAIEHDVFVANPGSNLCSPKWCGYWEHCAFGEGKAL